MKRFQRNFTLRPVGGGHYRATHPVRWAETWTIYHVPRGRSRGWFLPGVSARRFATLADACEELARVIDAEDERLGLRRREN